MTDMERFEFTVPGYSPETMPLDRLMEYLNQLIIILGQPSDLHLIGIKRGSTKPVLAMRHDVAVHARSRAREVRHGGGSARRREAFDAIRRLVSEDGGKTAFLKAPEGRILEFPKVNIGADQIVHSVRQQTSLDGELIRIGGRRENAQLLIQELSGNIIAGCTAPRSIARDIGQFIYRPIRVSGIGCWHRTAKGQWEISQLYVQSFEPLEEDTHAEIIAKLQSMRSNWPVDSAAQLLAMRSAA